MDGWWIYCWPFGKILTTIINNYNKNKFLLYLRKTLYYISQNTPELLKVKGDNLKRKGLLYHKKYLLNLCWKFWYY